MAFFVNFHAQQFYRVYPFYNKIISVIAASGCLSYLYLVFDFNINLFQTLRTVTFLFCLLMISQATYSFLRGYQDQKLRRKETLPLLISHFVFVLMASHDIMLALGIITSTSMLFFGSMLTSITIIWSGSNLLAATFMQNKTLLSNLKEINESLEHTVAERTRQIRVILDHVRHGFLLIGPDQKIQSGYTNSCLEIFGTDELLGKDYLELTMPEHQRTHYSLALHQVFDDMMPQAVSLRLLPPKFYINDQSYSASGDVIRDEKGNIKSLLFSIVNITDLEQAENENRSNRSLLTILAHRESFMRFLKETETGIDKVKVSLTDEATVRTELHTIKGNSMVYGLDDMVKEIHLIENEQNIEIKDIKKIENRLDGFINSNNKILNLERYNLNRISYTNEQLSHLFEELHSMKVSKSAIATMNHWFKEISYESARELLGLLPDQAQSIAKRMHKDIEMKICGGEILMDPKTSGPIFANLIHLVRNSIDHGIEEPEARKHKAKKGAIFISFDDTPTAWTIIFEDDGQGIDEEAVKEVAAKNSIASKSELDKMSPEQVRQLIFHPGFSSKDSATEISGRGIGMVAVKKSIEDAGGTIDISSKPNEGVSIIISIPKATKYHAIAS